MEKSLRILAIVLFCLSVAGCVYDYEPKDSHIQGLETPLVVIDGDIIAGGITHVKIGLTQSLSETEEVKQLNGVVWVESENGEILMGEQTNDKVNEFDINTEDLDLKGSYRLCVSIPDRGEYHSAFKKVLVSPEIDSITYSIPQDRSFARIEVTTHNKAEGEKLYCKWKYFENWESDARFPAEIDFDVKSGEMIALTPEQTYERRHCFSEARSIGTFIANTEKLTDNVIYKSIIKEIQNTDTRVMQLYSINVVQYALDKEAYIYWENVKNNSQGTGGLFSPQPSEVRGNIVNATLPDEVVVGYVNVTTVTEKRVFINWLEERIFKTDCKEELVEKVIPSNKEDGEPIYQWPIYYSSGYRPTRFDGSWQDKAFWAMTKCTDCRIYSNSTKPDFWPR